VDWIVSAGKDIAVDGNQLQSRRAYIHDVTNAEVGNWHYIHVNGKECRDFLRCVSSEGVDGTFITAHIYSVFWLCTLKGIADRQLVVANTCVWTPLAHKRLLLNMMKINPTVELRFAKQALSIESDWSIRQSVELRNMGTFGFQSSRSERELFRNRRDGFRPAIEKAFERVSPVLLPSDMGA